MKYMALIFLWIASILPTDVWGQEESKDGFARYVELAPMTVPIMDRGYLSGSFHIKIDLAVDSQDDYALVTQQLPRLESAYLSALSDLARTHLQPNAPADLGLVGRLLQHHTDRVLEDVKARVLITESAIRR